MDLNCDDDDDYIYESEEDSEPLEYTSDVASLEGSDARDASDSASEPEGFINRLETAPEGQRNMLDMSQGVRINEMDEESKIGMEHQQGGLSTDPPVAVTGLFTSPIKRLVRRRLGAPPDKASESGDSELHDLRECEGLEHLAGAGCQHHSGYCGFSISAEEMLGCATMQNLVLKTPEWTPEPDDQEFERSSSYFLSGLCYPMPSRDISRPSMTPPHHDADGCVIIATWYAQGPRIHRLLLTHQLLRVRKVGSPGSRKLL